MKFWTILHRIVTVLSIVAFFLILNANHILDLSEELKKEPAEYIKENDTYAHGIYGDSVRVDTIYSERGVIMLDTINHRAASRTSREYPPSTENQQVRIDTVYVPQQSNDTSDWFDKIMKLIQTLTPLAVPFLTFWLKSKYEKKEEDDS